MRFGADSSGAAAPCVSALWNHPPMRAKPSVHFQPRLNIALKLSCEGKNGSSA